jgi:hypothetical protein
MGRDGALGGVAAGASGGAGVAAGAAAGVAAAAEAGADPTPTGAVWAAAGEPTGPARVGVRNAGGIGRA